MARQRKRTLLDDDTLNIEKIRRVKTTDIQISRHLSRETLRLLGSNIPLLTRRGHLNTRDIMSIVSSAPPLVLEDEDSKRFNVFANLRSWELSQWLPASVRIPVLVMTNIDTRHIEPLCLRLELFNHIARGLEARTSTSYCENIRQHLCEKFPDDFKQLSDFLQTRKHFAHAINVNIKSLKR